MEEEDGRVFIDYDYAQSLINIIVESITTRINEALNQGSDSANFDESSIGSATHFKSNSKVGNIVDTANCIFSFL